MSVWLREINHLKAFALDEFDLSDVITDAHPKGPPSPLVPLATPLKSG